jgi:FG-GAP repeat.
MQSLRIILAGNTFKASSIFDSSARRVRVLKCAALLMLLFGAVHMPRGVAAAADLDSTFGTGGKVLTSLTPGLSESAMKVLVQPDGKIIVAGHARIYAPSPNQNSSDPFIARFNADGSPDLLFGLNGSNILNLGTTDCFINDAALQADGKIIIVGSYGFHNNGINSDYLILRFNADGTLDTSFDVDGIIVKGFGATNSDGAYGVVIQPDNKIVVGGTSIASGTNVSAILRYNPDGSPDTSFGVNGDGLSVVYNEGTKKLRMQPDGKFVTLPYNPFGQVGGRISRLNQNGTLDFSFGSGGVALINYNSGHPTPANDIAIQPDGKIIMAGSTNISPSNNDFKMTRYNSDGSPDIPFGTGGSVVTGITATSSDGATTVIVQPDGKIILGGSSITTSRQRTNFALARYNPNGSLIGKATTDFNLRVDFITSMALQADGKILAVGISNNTTTPTGTVATELDLAMARYVDITTLSVHGIPFDFDGDFKANMGVYRPGATPGANSYWYVLQGDFNTFQQIQFGIGEDKIVPADWNGDTVTDIAVWRPSTGTWYTSLNPSVNYGAFQWGTLGDIPVPGDFDGDEKADHAVYRPSTGYFYVRKSSDGSFIFQQFGTSADKPLLADFDGDFKTDFATVRVSGNDLVWNILRSSDGMTLTYTFGLATDKAVPADYDGDGDADIAVFRPSTGRWYNSFDPSTNYGEQLWGITNDVAVPADYEGDGKADLTVFRPASTFWYIRQSNSGTLFQKQWGITTDIPVGTAFIP